jgi:hypothetical protein
MYQPKTGEKCFCRRGVQRDNCVTCEGTGQRIDFAAIRQGHTHEFKTGLSKTVVVCHCGKFKFVDLKITDIIKEEK